MPRRKPAASQAPSEQVLKDDEEDRAAEAATGRPVAVEGPAETPDDFDTWEMYRVSCPDCGQSLALLADEEVLPEHALCPSPWNPFVLTVCPGAGRRAADAPPVDDSLRAHEQDTDLLLTLPEGLDWRTQPFSHAGGPGSRPTRVCAPR
ncbi:hypothetical protein ACFV3R_09070 [Streptomyces sp. NPDC059740]|uniref:hypothetical protein n=1 Tax=Streptomyces sp. NPDC059740 TaxID=3346926 RepID=UPI003655AAA2